MSPPILPVLNKIIIGGAMFRLKVGIRGNIPPFSFPRSLTLYKNTLPCKGNIGMIRFYVLVVLKQVVDKEAEP